MSQTKKTRTNDHDQKRDQTISEFELLKSKSGTKRLIDGTITITIIYNTYTYIWDLKIT